MGEFNLRKVGFRMVQTSLTLALCLPFPQADLAVAATRVQRCEAYAHNMARSAPDPWRAGAWRGGRSRDRLLRGGSGRRRGNRRRSGRDPSRRPEKPVLSLLL